MKALETTKHSCPTGYSAITTKHACQNARSALHPSKTFEEYSDQYPACYAWGDYVYFNPAPGTETDDTTYILCQAG